jgi:hypothetical protein
MHDWLMLMQTGRFEQAWELSDRDLDQRRGNDWTRPRHLQRIWDGSPVDNRRVLVRCYHGLGDTLQFARYLPQLRDIARTVLVWTQPSLIPLLRSSIHGIRFIALHDGTPRVSYDVDVEIMELPHVFRTTVETIPANVPYLQVQGRAKARARRRIGLMWRGGDWDGSRSIPFDLVASLNPPDATLVPLQPFLTEHEHARFPRYVARRTVTSLAREVANCDLVISVDTMVAHLAGALNVPTWTLLKHSADWRWMTGRTDSPWYPSMQLFRQPKPGDWTAVLNDVAARLAECRAARA